MSVTPQQILDSMAAFEASQPFDAGVVPLADDAAPALFAAALSQLTRSPDFAGASPERREAALVSSLTYALVEVALLREQLEAHSHAAAVESARLWSRITAR